MSSIFLSHAHQDSQLVNALDTLIKKVFIGYFEIFNSSNASITSGSIWREQIRTNLEKASVVMVVLTPHSVVSQWVFFEAGAVWFAAEAKKMRMIPCVFPNNLVIPSTLSELHFTKLADRGDLSKMLTDTLQPISGLHPTPQLIKSSVDEFMETINSLPTVTPTAQMNETTRFLEQVRKYYQENPIEFNNILRIARASNLITDEIELDFKKQLL